MTIAEIIIWIIIGSLAGSLAGMLVKRKKSGFGRWANLGIGLIGALIGGSLFNLLGVHFALGELSISVEDILSALTGSLIFLIIIWLVRKFWKSKEKTKES